MPLPRETDILVVGGGPAGLAAAIALREKGFDVVVADRSRPPIEKPCGEGLMPDALAALRKLGVSIGCEQSFPFRGICFLGSGTAASASFPSGHGLGIRRTALHQLLVDRAAEAGTSFLWDARVNGITSAGVVVDGQLVRSRWIVGADGQNSCVRRWAGLDGHYGSKRRFGFRRHYRIAPWSDCMELYWGAGYQIYLTPIGAQEVCVVLISRDRHLRLDHVLPGFPELMNRLQQAVAAGTERGAISVSYRFQNVVRDRVVLVGDASGSVDAITGEGLCLAFQQATALADALASGNLGDYEAAHRRLLSRPACMASAMLSLDKFPQIRRRVLRAFAAKPAVFATLLAAHVGTQSPTSCVLSSAIPLGWQMLTAGR